MSAKAAQNRPNPPPGPHVVILAGGTAARGVTIALIHESVRVTRLVPAWDSGGSSKLIREALHILPVGDIRQALMTMAYAEGHAGDIVRIFNARLSETGGRMELERELAFYSEGDHPVLRLMRRDVAEAILRYLRIFIAAAGPDFDWRRGSIGNFILTGALLAEDGDVNAAVLAFKELCGIVGDVWPVSTDHHLTLTAELNDGRHVEGQHAITGLSEEKARVGIKSVMLDRAAANPVACAAIAGADVVVYGPGSFFTSILPHLQVDGITGSLARSIAPKILIGNMLEDSETRGLTLDAMAERLLQAGAGKNVLTHILANDGAVPVERVIGASRFVKRGPSVLPRITIVARDFEDPWLRGTHDAGLLAGMILDIARKGVRQS